MQDPYQRPGPVPTPWNNPTPWTNPYSTPTPWSQPGGYPSGPDFGGPAPIPKPFYPDPNRPDYWFWRPWRPEGGGGWVAPPGVIQPHGPWAPKPGDPLPPGPGPRPTILPGYPGGPAGPPEPWFETPYVPPNPRYPGGTPWRVDDPPDWV